MWVGIGAGIGGIAAGEAAEQDGGDNVGAGGLYLSYQTGAHVFSLRGSVALEVFGENISDVGVLYGRATTGTGPHVSFGIGVAIVNGSYQEDGLDFCGVFSDPDACERASPVGFTTVGIPLEVQLALRGEHFGFGIYGFANLNPESSFAGVTVCVQIGRLR